MRGVFFPNSNLLFTVQTRDPAAPVPPPDPAAKGAGFSVFEWGQGIYTGWPVIENAAAALADASPWMLTPGLRCENGRLAPVTEPDWIRFTEQMVSVAKRGYRLAQTKNQEAVSEWTGDLSDACAACHSTYRDVGGRGRGANPLRRESIPRVARIVELTSAHRRRRSLVLTTKARRIRSTQRRIFSSDDRAVFRLSASRTQS